MIKFSSFHPKHNIHSNSCSSKDNGWETNELKNERCEGKGVERKKEMHAKEGL